MKIFPLRFSAFILCIAIYLGSAPSVSANGAPAVSAKSAILVESTSGETAFAKNEFERLPMASTTKIMTALVAIENCTDLSRTVKIDPAACGIEGSSIYLKADEALTMAQLLYALLLESANDAATAVAIEIAGSVEKFADMMNDTAKRLGMKDSHFTNSHGLDHEEHYTTASDMAKLAVYAMNNDAFLKIVSTGKATIPLNGDEGTRILVNHNKLLKLYDGAIGIKTGFTKRSGRCLVSAAERNGVRLIAVTLCAPDDWNDHSAMLDFGFTKYKHTDVVQQGSLTHSIPVTGGKTDVVTVQNRDSFKTVLPGDSPEIRCVVEAPRFVYAPVNEGDILGYARYYSGNKELCKIPLYALSSIGVKEKQSLWQRILDLYK